MITGQIQGLWKVKNQNLSDLYEEVKKLKDKFLSFKISHVLRVSQANSICLLWYMILLWVCILIPRQLAAYDVLTCSCIPSKERNTEADVQANLAITLAGETLDLFFHLCFLWIMRMVNWANFFYVFMFAILCLHVCFCRWSSPGGGVREVVYTIVYCWLCFRFVSKLIRYHENFFALWIKVQPWCRWPIFRRLDPDETRVFRLPALCNNLQCKAWFRPQNWSFCLHAILETDYFWNSSLGSNNTQYKGRRFSLTNHSRGRRCEQNMKISY